MSSVRARFGLARKLASLARPVNIRIHVCPLHQLLEPAGTDARHLTAMKAHVQMLT